MNESLRRSTPLFIAASALCALAACKQKRSPEAQPVVQRASLASVATPAAATAKPIDASEAVRGADRAQPTPRPAPCLSTSDGQDAPVPDLLEQAAREFEKGRFEGALECARGARAHQQRASALPQPDRVARAEDRGAEADRGDVPLADLPEADRGPQLAR